MVLRTVIAVNQLSVYGAVADLCKELARDSSSAEKPAANENLDSMVIPTEFPNANTISQTDMSVQGNLLRQYEQKFADLPEHDKFTKVCSNLANTKMGPVLDVMVCHQGRYGIEIMIESLFGDKTCSWVRIVNGIIEKVTETLEERETCCEG